MMPLTNKFGYPDAIALAVANDDYSKGDSEFSATELLKPSRIRQLEIVHKDEIEHDVDDKMFILYGHVAHGILERAGVALGTALIEKRFFGHIGKTKISAQIDSLSLGEDEVLRDWKFTTVYGFKAGAKPKDEWIEQMNIQLLLLRQNGKDAKALEIVGLLRDWRPGESKKDKKYPNKVGVHKIPMWSEERTTTFIANRILAHKSAKEFLPDCSPKETWNWNRCAGYCNVSKFCSQYQTFLKQKEGVKL